MRSFFLFPCLVLATLLAACAPAAAPTPAVTPTAVAEITHTPTFTATAVVPSPTPLPTDPPPTATIAPTPTAEPTIEPSPTPETTLNPEQLAINTTETERLVAILETHYSENNVQLTQINPETGQVEPHTGLQILNWWPDARGNVLPFSIQTMDYTTGQAGPWPAEVVQGVEKLKQEALLQQLPPEEKAAYLAAVEAGTVTEVPTVPLLLFNPETGQVENMPVPVDANVVITIVPIPNRQPNQPEMLPFEYSYANIDIHGNVAIINGLVYDKNNNTLHFVKNDPYQNININNESSRGRMYQSILSELIILAKNHHNLALNRGYTEYPTVGIPVNTMKEMFNFTIGIGKDGIAHTTEMTFNDAVRLPDLSWLATAHYLAFESSSDPGGVFLHETADGLQLLEVDDNNTVVSYYQVAGGTIQVQADGQLSIVTTDGTEIGTLNANGSVYLDTSAAAVTVQYDQPPQP